MFYASVNETWLLAVAMGGLFTLVNWWVIRLINDSRITPLVVVVVFMGFVSLHVHQLHGMIEAHFGYFVLLAILFTDLKVTPLLVAAAMAAVLYWRICYSRRISRFICSRIICIPGILS